jgi:AraC-like DNA-binding protein
MSLTRIAGVLPFVAHLGRLGAPVERYLREARIPVALLERPDAALPLEQAYRFGEIACRSEGIAHLGVWVGLETSLGDLGSYGRALEDSLTVYEYLAKGIRLIGTLSTGAHFWLTEHGPVLRFHYRAPGLSSIGEHQASVHSLMVVTQRLRKVAGPSWSPGELSLARAVPGGLPPVEALAETRVRSGTGENWFSLPRWLLGAPFNPPSAVCRLPRLDPPPLPEDVVESVRLAAESLLRDGYPDVNLVAEAFGASGRTLRRRLATQGWTYSELIGDLRLRLAAKWLASSDKPVSEISIELGYADASNFTRAFRRRSGVPPDAYRRAANGGTPRDA